MTNKEFIKLQEDIIAKMLELKKLQKKYHNETGQDYILGQGLSSHKRESETTS